MEVFEEKFFGFVFWCPYMVINVVSVQYNGGFLPEIILLTRPHVITL